MEWTCGVIIGLLMADYSFKRGSMQSVNKYEYSTSFFIFRESVSFLEVLEKLPTDSDSHNIIDYSIHDNILNSYIFVSFIDVYTSVLPPLSLVPE